MKKLFLTIVLCGVVLAINAKKVASPNGKLSAKTVGKNLVISYKKQKVLELADIQFEKLAFDRRVTDDYQMLEGKRLHCTNEANEFRAALGTDTWLVLRLYNDGIAFRYEYSNLQNQKPPQEQTTYLIPEGTKRWMMQWAESYEGFFPQSTTYKQKPVPSFSGISASADGWNNRWAYPALLEASPGVFALITEANIERGQSASCLYNDGERFSVVPAENNLELNGEWHTPWRVVIIGTLANIVQSTLVTDVSEPSKVKETRWISPGVVSWVYWAYNHGSNDYNIIRKYVDMAVALHLPYVLIDAEWDEMDKLASNEGKTIVDAVSYAHRKGIKPLIWYNSSVGWINGAPGPKFRLNKPEDREKEFAWCEKIGVVGVKIDFFSGDNQKNMDYCLDLLECAPAIICWSTSTEPPYPAAGNAPIPTCSPPRASMVPSGTTTWQPSPTRRPATTPRCPSRETSSVLWTIRLAPSATRSIPTSPRMPTNWPSRCSSRAACNIWQTVRRVSCRSLRRCRVSLAGCLPSGTRRALSPVIRARVRCWLAEAVTPGMWLASTARTSPRR